MEAPETSKKKKGPIINQAQCRCCRSMKKCRLLTAEYEFSGKREVYSDMFMDCFGLLLSHLDGEDEDLCICATCVVRLREASAFRHQVLQCEQLFLAAHLEIKGDPELNVSDLVEVKIEPLRESDKDEEMDVEEHPEIPGPDSKVESTTSVVPKVVVPRKAIKVRPQGADKNQDLLKGKRDLLRSMQQMKAKLNRMLKKAPQQKKPAPTRKIEKDDDLMIYTNAVTLVHNSYICPFINRLSIYYCYYCRDQYTNPFELREHTLTHSPEIFESSMEYGRMPKIDITRIDCRLCAEKIDDLTALKSHLATVHGKKIFPVSNEFLTFKLLTADSVMCTECNEVFPYFDALQKHVNNHFGTYICDYCGDGFLAKKSLRAHLKSHNRVDKFFTCEICGKKLKSIYSKNNHILTVHEKKQLVNCYKCDATFLSTHTRTKHLIEAHGDIRTFTCKVCSKVFNRRQALNEHMRFKHSVHRHQCDLCGQRFYVPSDLKKHKAMHTGENVGNFKCEFCDRSYLRLRSLQQHKRVHNDEKINTAM